MVALLVSTTGCNIRAKMGAYYISRRKAKAPNRAKDTTQKHISGSDLRAGMKPLPEDYIPRKNDVIMGRGKVGLIYLLG